MKTKEELNALKEEVETLNKKLAELTEEELAQVSGGGPVIDPPQIINGFPETLEHMCRRYGTDVAVFIEWNQIDLSLLAPAPNGEHYLVQNKPYRVR